MKDFIYYFDKYFNKVPEWTDTWNKGWNPTEYRAMKPFNPISKTVYRGKNSRDLYLPQWEESKMGKEIDLRFSTRKQIETNGGCIRQNAHPYQIRYFKEGKSYYHTVYSYSDVYFIDSKFSEYAPHYYHFNEDNAAEKMLKNINVKIVQIKDIQPSFVPHENTIYLPFDFKNNNRKYECVLHELMHWTKYNFPSCSRSETYPSEECIAEYGMLMLYEELFGKVPDAVTERALDYCASWLKSFPEDLKLKVLDDISNVTYISVSKLLRFSED